MTDEQALTVLATLEPCEMRGKILDIEDALKRYAEEHPEQAFDPPPTHHFADGLYGRELFVPKGTFGTSKIHLREHLCIIAKGDVSVLSEHGIRRIVGPAVIVTKPGEKRLVYAHEDTVWLTVHACEEREIEKVEKLLVADTYEQASEALKGEQAWPSLQPQSLVE